MGVVVEKWDVGGKSERERGDLDGVTRSRSEIGRRGDVDDDDDDRSMDDDAIDSDIFIVILFYDGLDVCFFKLYLNLERRRVSQTKPHVNNTLLFFCFRSGDSY